MIRAALVELEREATRRAFFRTLGRTSGLVAALDRFGPKLFGADGSRRADARIPYAVYGAIGNLVIPVDEDPGWATFEPDITNYGVDVFTGQVFLAGNKLALDGYKDALTAMNEAPVTLQYGPKFLEMTTVAQSAYFSSILTGQFENDGFQDILDFAANLALVTTKATFFSNFPRHRAQPGAEFQVLPPSNVKTGWDIMQFKGPVGPDEEKQLRDRYSNIEELPGVDPRNPYI